MPEGMNVDSRLILVYGRQASVDDRRAHPGQDVLEAPPDEMG